MITGSADMKHYLGEHLAPERTRETNVKGIRGSLNLQNPEPYTPRAEGRYGCKNEPGRHASRIVKGEN